MNMLNLIIEEYISIVKILEDSNSVENDRIIIEREEFKNLLEKYAYMTFAKKTKIYKALNFIIHDKNNYTMPYKDSEQKKTVRKVIINYATYTIVKEVYNTNVTS